MSCCGVAVHQLLNAAVRHAPCPIGQHTAMPWGNGEAASPETPLRFLFPRCAPAAGSRQESRNTQPYHSRLSTTAKAAGRSH